MSILVVLSGQHFLSDIKCPPGYHNSLPYFLSWMMFVLSFVFFWYFFRKPNHLYFILVCSFFISLYWMALMKKLTFCLCSTILTWLFLQHCYLEHHDGDVPDDNALGVWSGGILGRPYHHAGNGTPCTIYSQMSPHTTEDYGYVQTSTLNSVEEFNCTFSLVSSYFVLSLTIFPFPSCYSVFQVLY